MNCGKSLLVPSEQMRGNDEPWWTWNLQWLRLHPGNEQWNQETRKTTYPSHCAHPKTLNGEFNLQTVHNPLVALLLVRGIRLSCPNALSLKSRIQVQQTTGEHGATQLVGLVASHEDLLDVSETPLVL
jgi:hypothetical protein